MKNIFTYINIYISYFWCFGVLGNSQNIFPDRKAIRELISLYLGCNLAGLSLALCYYTLTLPLYGNVGVGKISYFP